MNNLTIKTLGVAIFCATLAACGGGDDPVVDSDPGTGTGGGGTGGTGGGGTGGGTGGGGTGGGTGGGGTDGGGTDGGGTDGGDGGREGNGPDLPDGTPLAATAGGEIMSAEFPCKIELFDGTMVTSETAVMRTLSFDPATLTLSVDGEVVLDGEWGYINQSSEYENESTTTTAGVTDEVFSKIFHTGAPAYLRSKTTDTADYSYEQLECYQGLIVQ